MNRYARFLLAALAATLSAAAQERPDRPALLAGALERADGTWRGLNRKPPFSSSRDLFSAALAYAEAQTNLTRLDDLLEGGLAARNLSMLYRNEEQLSVLDDRLNAPGEQPAFFERFAFAYPGGAAMNWFITEENLRPDETREFIQRAFRDGSVPTAGVIAEAASRPTMRFVELKTQEQLDIQTLHRVRSRLVAERRSLTNRCGRSCWSAGPFSRLGGASWNSASMPCWPMRIRPCHRVCASWWPNCVPNGANSIPGWKR